MKKRLDRISTGKKILFVLLFAVMAIASFIIESVYLRSQNHHNIPESDIYHNSIYIDAKGKLFIGVPNSVMILSGKEIMIQWMYLTDGSWMTKINDARFSEDGKLLDYKPGERMFSGRYHFTKDDTLILRGDLGSKTYKLQRIKLKRYDKDKVPWDKYPLSDQAKQWLFAYE